MGQRSGRVEVGRCRLNPGWPWVDRAWCQRLSLNVMNRFQNLLSNSTCAATSRCGTGGVGEEEGKAAAAALEEEEGIGTREGEVVAPAPVGTDG